QGSIGSAAPTEVAEARSVTLPRGQVVRLVVVTALAVTLAGGAAACVVGRPLVVLGSFVAAAAIALISLHSVESSGTARPEVPELLLAIVDGTKWPAMFFAFLVAYYWGLVGVVALVRRLLSVAGLDWSGHWLVLVAFAVFAIFLGLGV